MAEYLSPGGYVEEVDAGPKPIEGVSTSTAGAIGVTARGPTSGKPELVTSFAEFQRKFGGIYDVPDTAIQAQWNTDDGGYWWRFPLSVQGFFEKAIEREFFAGYQPQVALFRTFFKTCLDRYVSNEVKAAQRLKRGGPAAGLRFEDAEQELERAGAAAWESPEDCFEREWRRQLFVTALAALEQRAAEQGKQAAFRGFKRYDLATKTWLLSWACR